jgi:hypothetical protein
MNKKQLAIGFLILAVVLVVASVFITASLDDYKAVQPAVQQTPDSGGEVQGNTDGNININVLPQGGTG